MNRISPSSDRRQRAFTLMEILVVVAIIIVLAAIGVPAYMMVRQNANKSVAINKMQQLGAAFVRFTNEQNGALPIEDVSGKDDWAAAQDPKNERVWYNALPKLAGVRNVKDYAADPEAFYKNDNLLYLPGAKYPPVDKAIAEPIFAIAMNSRLQRKESGAQDAKKPEVRLANVQKPATTVAFLECGIKGEKKAVEAQPGYNGNPKANGRAFVARYNDTGILCFIDGHIAAMRGKDVLDNTGHMFFPQSDVIWTANPEDDPNEKPTP